MLFIQHQTGNLMRLKQIHAILSRMNSNTSFKSSKSLPESSQKEIDSSVPGLSTKVLNVTSEVVGPGASKTGKYKNPEYFSYHAVSFYDAEIEMMKFRLPQPSAKSN